jgi:hypothetical protein
MKKIFFIICFAFTSFFGFSQAKYITFTDSIIFDSGLLYSIENYNVAEIPSMGGYAFTGTINDWVNLNYYYAKLDFAGNIVSDNLISITPMNTGPYPTILANSVSADNVTIWSVVSNVSYKDQPSLLSIDIDGNYEWAKQYEIDTLSFQVFGGIRCSDGGLLTYGGVSDWGQLNMGFILKTDQNGTILWSNFYGQGTPIYPEWRGKIDNLTETPDGGFLFSYTIGESEEIRSPKITKIDANGVFQWAKTIEFSAPINNEMSSSANVYSISLIDDNSVLITTEVLDTTLAITKLGLISMDLNLGSANWSKSYYLNLGDGNFNLQKLIRKSDGNYVGYFNQDMTGSVLFELNQFGEMINTVQLRELPLISGNDTYYNGINPTEDGGVILSSALLSNYQGILLFKTDKNLETHCPETEYPSLPNEDVLDIVISSSFDTSYAVTFSEQILSLASPMTISQSTTDPYCGCELSVFGNVEYSGAYADSVKVFLYQVTGTGSYVKIDSTETDEAGYYQFDYLPEGGYIVKAVPSIIKYPDYLPSYFNYSNPTNQWDSALVFDLICGNNPLSLDISLMPKLPQTGSWQCSGYVYKYFGYPGDVMKKAPGDPIGDIDITLDQTPGGAISSTTTDQNGYYEFTGLDDNATFIVRADLPGLPNDSVYTFTVNPGDGTLDSLNFYVDSVGVYILPEDLFTGVSVKFIESNQFNVVPNPTSGQFSLIVDFAEKSKIEIKVVSLLGEEVLSESYNLGVGENKVKLNLTNQAQGVYFIRIKLGDDFFIKKIVKQ